MISSLHECLDKQMIAIGHLEVAACYREGTKTYKENQDKGMTKYQAHRYGSRSKRA